MILPSDSFHQEREWNIAVLKSRTKRERKFNCAIIMTIWRHSVVSARNALGARARPAHNIARIRTCSTRQGAFRVALHRHRSGVVVVVAEWRGVIATAITADTFHMRDVTAACCFAAVAVQIFGVARPTRFNRAELRTRADDLQREKPPQVWHRDDPLGHHSHLRTFRSLFDISLFLSFPYNNPEINSDIIVRNV